jgi:hypothetical protein
MGERARSVIEFVEYLQKDFHPAIRFLSLAFTNTPASGPMV